MLELERVTLRAGATPVLDDVSLSVGQEIVCLVGPSGGGKTTLLRVILGLTAPQAGTVRIAGRDVTEGARILVPPLCRGLAVVFQDLALWPHLTVREHLAFVLGGRLPRAEREDRIQGMLVRVGLPTAASRRPGELSGGERQRVAIARALVGEPRAVLFDEPLSNLDVAAKADLLDLFEGLVGAARLPALFVTHDPAEAARLCGRLVVLEHGRVVQAGTIAKLRAAPASAFVQRFAADPAFDRRGEIAVPAAT